MDLWTELLALVSQVVTPIWNELIQYIPLLFFGIIPLFFLVVVGMWRRHAAANASRVPARLPAGPVPDGLHLPNPSIWPFVAPIGLFFIFLSLVLGNQSGPNLLLLAIGLGVAALAAFGWFLDARKEYDATEAGDHHLVVVEETDGYPVEQQVPEGIHLPPPSVWPFLAPIGLFFVFLGIVLGPVLIAGGLVMAAIAAVGWMLDAGREYHEVADGAHQDPEMRDPERAAHKGLMPIYVGIAVLSITLTLGPWLLTLLPKTTDVIASGPTPTTEPYVSAVSVVGFDQKAIVAPADTPFTITFDNQQAGVPHNIAIFADAAKTEPIYNGDKVDGPATAEYAIDALAAGEYPFICSFHPNMQATLIVK